MMYNKRAVKELQKLLLEKYSGQIEKIILFGSKANGNSDLHSDYDILIILKSNYNCV